MMPTFHIPRNLFSKPFNNEGLETKYPPVKANEGSISERTTRTLSSYIL